MVNRQLNDDHNHLLAKRKILLELIFLDRYFDFNSVSLLRLLITLCIRTLSVLKIGSTLFFNQVYPIFKTFELFTIAQHNNYKNMETGLHKLDKDLNNHENQYIQAQNN